MVIFLILLSSNIDNWTLYISVKLDTETGKTLSGAKMQLQNSKGEVVLDGSGDFGAEAYHLISMKYNGTDIEETTDSFVNIS